MYIGWVVIALIFIHTHVLLRLRCYWQLDCQQHSNNHCTMEKPTVLKLVEYLVDLTKWVTFAEHLPKIEQRHIDQIKEENKGEIDDQKRALYKKWLEVCPDATWNDVIEALKKAERNDIAKKVKQQEEEKTVHQDTNKGI